MPDSNETQTPTTSADLRALIGKTEADLALKKENVSSLGARRDENIMDDAFCEAIEDEMSKAEKEARRLEVRIRHLQEKLKNITKKENREAAHRKITEAKLATDLTADLMRRIYERAAREIAATMFYSEQVRKKVELARWYCDQAGIEKCHIPSPTQIIRNTKFATEEIASMCNLPDIIDPDKAYWTPDNSLRPAGSFGPNQKGISGAWRRHDIVLPDFEEILKAKNPGAALAKIIEQYASGGQVADPVDVTPAAAPPNPPKRQKKKAAG